MIRPSFAVRCPRTRRSAKAGNKRGLAVFTREVPWTGACCRGLTGCAKVRAPNGFTFLCGFFLYRGELMKKLVAMIFFALLAGNAMAQAGGASAGAGGGAAGSAAGATAGTVATVAAVVAGVAAASQNPSSH